VQTSVESDRLVRLTVLRLEGNVGRVVVSWQATATLVNSAVSVHPYNGTVSCRASVSYCNVIITVGILHSRLKTRFFCKTFSP